MLASIINAVIYNCSQIHKLLNVLNKSPGRWGVLTLTSVVCNVTHTYSQHTHYIEKLAALLNIHCAYSNIIVQCITVSGCGFESYFKCLNDTKIISCWHEIAMKMTCVVCTCVWEDILYHFCVLNRDVVFKCNSNVLSGSLCDFQKK